MRQNTVGTATSLITSPVLPAAAAAAAAQLSSCAIDSPPPPPPTQRFLFSSPPRSGVGVHVLWRQTDRTRPWQRYNSNEKGREVKARQDYNNPRVSEVLIAEGEQKAGGNGSNSVPKSISGWKEGTPRQEGYLPVRMRPLHKGNHNKEDSDGNILSRDT